MHAETQPVADGGSHVAGLYETLEPLIAGQTGAADDHRGMSQLFIGPGAALAHDAVTVFALAHGRAVVGNQHDHGVGFKAEVVDGPGQMAEPLVHVGELFGIEHTDVMKFLIGVHAFHVGLNGEKHVLALVVGVVHALLVGIIDGWGIPGFMGIKAVDPHEERLVLVYAGKVLGGLLEDMGGVLIFIALPVLTFLQVAFDLVEQRAHHVFAEDFVGLVDDVLFHIVFGLEHGGQIVLGIVLMVCFMAVQEVHTVEAAGVAEFGQTPGASVIDQIGFDGLSPAEVGNGGVVDVELRPALHGQSVTAGEHGTAAGHGGKAFGVAVLEQRTFRGKTVDVGGFDPGVAVAAQIVELHGVAHDHNSVSDFSHGFDPLEVIEQDYFPARDIRRALLRSDSF